MVTINYNYNKFIFISELAGLRKNPSSKARVSEWLKQGGGQLSNEEKKYLNRFKKYFRPFNIYYIESMFMTYDGKTLQQKISQAVGAEAADFLFEFLKLIDKRFVLLWKKQELILKKLKEKLVSKNNNLILSEHLAIKLIKPTKSTQPIVYLLMSSNLKTDFSAWSSTVGKNSTIVIEGGFKEPVANILAVYLHELIHVYLKTNIGLQNNIKLVAKQLPKKVKSKIKGLSADKIVEEIMISALTPEGYLAKKCFPKSSIIVKKRPSVSRNYLLSVRRLVAYELSSLVSDYIKESKNIDLDFLNKIIQEIKTV